MTDLRDAKDFAGLPPEAAFVLQLQSDADVAAGVIAGRVEHIISGHSTRFRSLDELLAFLARVAKQTGSSTRS